MDPKTVPEFDFQNGVQKWHPKNQNIGTLFLGAIFRLHFGGQTISKWRLKNGVLDFDLQNGIQK